MSTYFEFFPTLNYDITGDKPTQTTEAVDIFVRQRLTDEVRSRAVTYYPYVIQDKERPDIIAHNYYGDVKYTWLIFFANDIIDPYFDWPMDSNQFKSFITKKYGSIRTSMTEVHAYYQKIRAETSTNPETLYEVDNATYNSLDASIKTMKSKYDHESEKNDMKRHITLLEDVYVSKIFSLARKAFV
jgi:hypothetical protein